MARFKLTPDAEDDITRIYRYGVQNWGVDAADKYYSELYQHFRILANDPLLYPTVDHVRLGYRRSLCENEMVYYRISDYGILIVGVIGRQDTSLRF
ncbi:type II toxin-antitoxin system RelE/ParE family toxin [Robiginitomaculum antarcticum]|uniref:type II toxin-antitoxin system RelE/ParE family toxin n=1 Tax=Robiginitomaculum antarcticum TaxID=437507 RepID=UPI00037DF867|nr:type II toxin-antitoxin system RelE/ParE family toxin [Robiginitomaculum antarcticum]